jgi:hypothetical protein
MTGGSRTGGGRSLAGARHFAATSTRHASLPEPGGGAIAAGAFALHFREPTAADGRDGGRADVSQRSVMDVRGAGLSGFECLRFAPSTTAAFASGRFIWTTASVSGSRPQGLRCAFSGGGPHPVPSKPGKLLACDQATGAGCPEMTPSRRPCQNGLGRAAPQRAWQLRPVSSWPWLPARDRHKTRVRAREPVMTTDLPVHRQSPDCGPPPFGGGSPRLRTWR